MNESLATNGYDLNAHTLIMCVTTLEGALDLTMSQRNARLIQCCQHQTNYFGHNDLQRSGDRENILTLCSYCKLIENGEGI
jgi:hypothetical protein